MHAGGHEVFGGKGVPRSVPKVVSLSRRAGGSDAC
jgi:hypothetical protein